MVELFEHNQAAYDAATAMLAETGKAAVIHPTGTGKSFIGFKLCEDNPDKTICWLSSSEYIFRTQLENVKAASGYEPKNIKFYTYAKLLYFSEDGLAEIKPNYLVLDEFHRVGAQCWQTGVKKLEALYPAVPTLGLSATNVQYLDNQRDMAVELFDGNIASEMSLGEAVVRGILLAPKYVIATYAVQESLDVYQKRFRRSCNKSAQQEAERILEKIRRSLEEAEGLDEIFRKHITDKSGKYILFVPRVETMQEIKVKCLEWFAQVDSKPHIYCTYAVDPEASKEFEAFKADNSDHLKVLLAIN